MSALAHYIDRSGTLGELEQTPQGGYRVPARLARVGVAPYTARYLRKQGLDVPAQFADSDTVMIFTSPEVLQAAMATVADSPVTNEHPPEFVTPQNYKKYADGTVSSGTVEFDGQFLRASLAIQDSKLLSDIERGVRREVSMGYMAGTRFEDGVFEGKPFHAVRTKVVYNHSAIVSAGRQGEQVCLALDSAEIPDGKEKTMKFTVNGQELEGEAVQAALDGLQAQLDAKVAEIAALNDAKAAAEALAAQADSDEAFEAKLTARRVKEEAEAKKAERLASCKAAYPALAASLDSASEDYISGLLAAVDADPEGLKALKDKNGSVKAEDAKSTDERPAGKPPAKPRLSARQRMILERDGKLANK